MMLPVCVLFIATLALCFALTAYYRRKLRYRSYRHECQFGAWPPWMKLQSGYYRRRYCSCERYEWQITAEIPRPGTTVYGSPPRKGQQ